MSRDRAADAGVTVREAAPDDRLGVRRVLDAAMLDVREDLPERIADGDALVAVEDASDSDDSDAAILGALVLVPRDDSQADGDGVGNVDRGAHVDAVAVRRARRGQGIGSALVRAAAERRGRLTAEFDAGVRPFYESLGFEVEAVEGATDRFRGRYGAQSA